MNRLHKKRLTYFFIIAILLSSAAALMLYSLKKNINVFLTPKEIVTSKLLPNTFFRLGGMVKTGSIKHDAEGLGVNFVVTDFSKDIAARYVGVLPDLFHEGKGVIAEGSINENGVFIATQVLAKHDENYMPKKVYKSIRENT